jgi:hypothetical protein
MQAFQGAAVKDGKSYPFAREIDGPASYDGFAINGPHLLIEAAQFSSSLDIYATKAVVVRGVSVQVVQDSPISLLVRPGAGTVYVLWSDIGGSDGAKAGAGVALRGKSATLFRSHVSNAADGLSISASGVTITESLIETRTASSGDHNDAIQLLGAPEHITIARTRSSTAIRRRAAFMSWAGTSIFGREFFAKSGHFGAVSYWEGANIWHENRFSDGAAIEL